MVRAVRGMVGEGDAPQLDVVLGRNADLGVDLQVAMALAKLRARLGENGFVTFGRAQGRLMSGGPEFAGRHIAQIKKRAPAIAGGILAPAGDRQIPPATVTAAGIADRRRDSGRWTGDELRACADLGLLKTRMTSSPSPKRGSRFFQLEFFRQDAGGGFGNALLQQQIRRSEQGHDMKRRCIGRSRSDETSASRLIP